MKSSAHLSVGLNRRAMALGVMGAMAMPLAAQTATAYPNRPIRLVVPYAPGGGLDTIMRLLAPKLSEILGQPITVENKAGGGTMIATDMVAKAAGDGYTWLATGAPIFLNPALGIKTPYDALRDLVPISLVVNNPGLLLVNNSLGVKTVKELVALDVTQKGGLNYGSAGQGSITHLGGELLKSRLKLKIQHIPFNGSAPALTSLMGAQIPVLVDAMIPSFPQVKAGKVTALAIFATERSPLLPEVPTMAEMGYANMNFGGTFGLMAPASTPPDIIQKIHVALMQTLQSPEMRKNLVDRGFQVIGNTPTEYGQYIRREIEVWTQIVKDNQIKPE